MNSFFNAATRSVLVLFLGIGLSRCGSDNDVPSFSLDDAEYILVDEGTVDTSSSSQISGSGSIVFDAPLSGIASKHSFELLFELEDGESLSLVSHSNDQLEGGIEIEFSRAGSSLDASISVGGDAVDISAALASIDASQEIALQVDVHNDEEPTHILIWDGEDFAEDVAVFNSEEGALETPGNGSGSFWGLILDGATVKTANQGEPKFIENE